MPARKPVDRYADLEDGKADLNLHHGDEAAAVSADAAIPSPIQSLSP